MSNKSELSYQAFCEKLDETVRQAIEAWPQGLQEQLQRAYQREAAKSDFSISVRDELAENLNSQSAQFFQKIEEMPLGYELNFVLFKKQTPRGNKKLRRTFNRKVLSEFLKYLSFTKVERLKQMGLTNDDIEKMKMGIYPSHKSVKGDCYPIINVEHIIPLSGGGNNSFDNLYLVPISVNNYTAWFSSIQTRDMKYGDEKLILLMVPTKGPRQGYNVYPFDAPRHCSIAALKCACR